MVDHCKAVHHQGCKPLLNLFALSPGAGKQANGLERAASSREALTRQPSSSSKGLPPATPTSQRTVLSQKAQKPSGNGAAALPRVWSGSLSASSPKAQGSKSGGTDLPAANGGAASSQSDDSPSSSMASSPTALSAKDKRPAVTHVSKSSAADAKSAGAARKQSVEPTQSSTSKHLASSNKEASADYSRGNSKSQVAEKLVPSLSNEQNGIKEKVACSVGSPIGSQHRDSKAAVDSTDLTAKAGVGNRTPLADSNGPKVSSLLPCLLQKQAHSKCPVHQYMSMWSHIHCHPPSQVLP